MCMHYVHLFHPHFRQDAYMRATRWMEQNPDCHFGKGRGISHINGTTYYLEVKFKHSEDKLAFIFAFPELLL